MNTTLTDDQLVTLNDDDITSTWSTAVNTDADDDASDGDDDASDADDDASDSDDDASDSDDDASDA